MDVRSAMSAEIQVVSPGLSVKRVAEQMRRQGIGYFPVCDRRGLVGIVTDRDLACRVVAEGRDAQSTKVRDVMSTEIVWCHADDTLTDAVALMERHRIRRIPVLDHKDQLIGILSLTDIAAHAPEHLTAAVLEAASHLTRLSVTLTPNGEVVD